MNKLKIKKILIITNRFPPAFAPRMGYLVKYLPQYGWDADIITINTKGDNNFNSLIGKNKIINVDLKNEEPPKNKIETFLRLCNLFFRYKNNHKPLISAAINNLNEKDYSAIVVSTAWEIYVLQAGVQLAKKWKKPLIADHRDIHEQKPVEPNLHSGIKRNLFDAIYNRFNSKVIEMRNQALKKVDAITTVSPWHVHQLEKFNKNSFLIYNGYDPETYYPYENKKQEQFKITYTGSINSIALRDPSLLFDAIEQISNDGIINHSLLRIQFYIPERDEILIRNLKHFKKIEKFVDFYRYVDTSEVPKLLNDSSILLLLTNLSDKKGPKGVISTTRFFEYLAVERPILAVKSDEDSMEQAMRIANAGISARNMEETRNFILEKWNEWKETGYTSIQINQEYKQQFSRKLQAKQFVDVIKKVI